jgi:hypothetical protein
VTSTSAATAISNYYLHSQASFTSACSVAPGTATPNNDIFCYVDVAEFDLFYNGISLRFNAPAGMCPYVKVRPYVYWGLQPGTVAAGASCTATINQQTGVNSGSCSASSNLTWDGAEFVCNYDYTASDGPNCCEGQYTLVTKTIDNTGTATFSSPSTVKMSGHMNNCYVGPGKDLAGFQNSKGWPVAVAYKDQGSGNNDKIDLASPLAKNRVSNIYLSNYYNPTDYQRNVAETGSFPVANAGDIPKAFESMLTGDPVNPFYEFLCTDGAEDQIARIRVMIRSWDTVSNFTAMSNPYTDPTTNEPGFNSDFFLHDRSVWTDFSPTHVNAEFGDIYPGMTL